MTALLSFQESDRAGQVMTTLTLNNWREIVSDSYFRESSRRTFRIALPGDGARRRAWCAGGLHSEPHARAVAIAIAAARSDAAADLRHRAHAWMGAAVWPQGPLSNLPAFLGLGHDPVTFLFTETGIVVALTHVLTPFMVLSVWASLQQTRPADRKRGRVAWRIPDNRVPPCGAAANPAGYPLRRRHRFRPGRQRLRDTVDHRRPAPESRIRGRL